MHFQSAYHPQVPRSLLGYPRLLIFARAICATHARPPSARSTGFCVIWVCISSSSSYWRAHSPASYPTSSRTRTRTRTRTEGNRPAGNVLPNLSTTAVVPGSWAYGPRGQPNEEADCDSSCRCQEDSNDEKDYSYSKFIRHNIVTLFLV